MFAAIWPTACLSMPRTITTVGCGTSNSMPFGGFTVMVWENPSASSMSLPFAVSKAGTERR